LRWRKGDFFTFTEIDAMGFECMLDLHAVHHLTAQHNEFGTYAENMDELIKCFTVVTIE